MQKRVEKQEILKNITRSRRGQFSWTWTYTSASLALLTITFIYIIFNEIIDKISTPLLEAGANAENMGMLDGSWSFTPVLFLFAYGTLVWIVAAATRGGQ